VLAHRVLSPGGDLEAGADERERIVSDLLEKIEVPI
jgi:hypothetical protein